MTHELWYALFGCLSYSETDSKTLCTLLPSPSLPSSSLTSPPLPLPHPPPPSPHLPLPPPQAIYTLVIYVFFGWERLSRRYKKRNIPQQNSIALTPLRASYKVGSRSPNMAGSKQHLVEEEGVSKSHDSHMTLSV